MSRRTLVIGTRTWKYSVGRAFAVAKSDAGERRTCGVHELLDITPYEHERRLWKGCANAAVTPKHVAAWLSS